MRPFLSLNTFNTSQLCRETDRLAFSLRCTEFLSDSPSTSSGKNMELGEIQRGERKKTRGVLQQWPSTSQHTLRQIPRKRALVDVRLNSVQHSSVRTPSFDKGIHTNPRVLSNLLSAEESASANSHYFDAVQEEIGRSHREQAIDWIYDVSKEKDCEPDVFPLAVSLIDRFLSIQNIFVRDLQTLAGTCLFIASKMKAPKPLNATNISYYTAGSVGVSDVLSWEVLILSKIGWDISQPIALDFFDHMASNYPSLHSIRSEFIQIMHKMQRSHKLGLFLPSLQACLSLLHSSVNQPNPIVLADARHCIANLFQIEIDLLSQYLPYIDRYCVGRLSPSTPLAPPSSSDQRSSPEVCEVSPLVMVQAQRSSLPATPLNDSGFSSSINSSVASPDVCIHKTSSSDSDCSPPKMRRSE